MTNHVNEETLKYALSKGYKVHWKNEGYEVKQDDNKLIIVFTDNQYTNSPQPSDLADCFIDAGFIVYDNEGETFDRFTIFKEEFEQNNTPQEIALSCSYNCDMPTGVSMIGYAVQGDHLGKMIKFEELPRSVQLHVLGRMA